MNNAVTRVLKAAIPTDRQTNKRQKKGKKGNKVKRAFDLDNYVKRTIAVKFFYNGERYDGLARQNHTDVRCYVDQLLFWLILIVVLNRRQ